MCDPGCCTTYCDPFEQMDMKSKPRELKGGIYTKCDCTYRNGLQDSCLREDCKRPKRGVKHGDNSYDIERLTQPQSIQMPQQMTMSKLGNGSSFNGLSDYSNQSGGNAMSQLMGLNNAYFAPQSYQLGQQLNMNNLSPQQFSSQEPQTFMQSPQTYNGIPENSLFSNLPSTDGAALSPNGMNAMGLGNMFNNMGGGGGGGGGGSGGMGPVMSSGGGAGGGMPTITTFSGMGGNGMSNMANMGNMGNMGTMTNISGMSALANMANMGGMAGMGNSAGMSNLGGAMGSAMTGGMGGGGGMYQNFPQMTGFGDGQQQSLSQCY